MKKIANASELQTELQRVLHYAGTKNPSRQKLARALNSLAHRVAGSTDERDLYDALYLIASNDGDSYRKKDASGAVQKAFSEYSKEQSANLRADFRSIKSKLTKDLQKRWSEE